MPANRSAPQTPLIPHLIYDDVDAAIAWLCRVFRFVERLRAPDASGRAGHAQLTIAEGAAVILGVSRRGQSPEWDDAAEFGPPRGRVGQSLMIRVDDVDAHYERVRAADARVLDPPMTYPYGERQYTVEDPEGHRWSFTQSVADVAPAAWGAVEPGQ